MLREFQTDRYENAEQKGFEGLEVWQMARKIASSTYELTANFPKSEQFGLTSQMRRAAVSIGSNIAEGWGRQTDGNFANFLKISRGSLSELQSLSYTAFDLNFIDETQLNRTLEQSRLLSRKLYNLIDRLGGKYVKELETQ